MSDGRDPRVFFAAERTLLAWIRTGLTVMGLGFVVARFGLFLQVIRREADATPHLGSTVIGVGLVVLGSVVVAMATWQHLSFCRTLSPDELPRANMSNWSVVFAALLAMIGVVLAAYLLLRSNLG